MKEPSVTIIMPIYNASPYLKESLGGIVQQTLKNIEIICVNDGSKDDSLLKIKEYAKIDSRIKIIDKKNSGYGNTMNEGLKLATGEYIGILEPDDFAEPEMFEYLYREAIRCNADVVKSNYYEHLTRTGTDTFLDVLSEMEYGKVCCAKENERIIFMRPCIWSAIYKRKFLLDNHILFNETPGASYQDTAFAFKVWVCAERVLFIKEAFLHYRIDNENSSVNSSGKIFCICDEFHAMEAFLNEDKNRRDRYSKILQVLKLDSYTWNLDRIAPEFKYPFQVQTALEFMKAQQEGFIDKVYFDEERWQRLEKYLSYGNTSTNKCGSEKELADFGNYSFGTYKERIYELEHCEAYRLGRMLLYIPAKIKRFFKKQT